MIGVIADDLSGAAEIGAVGLRFGLSAEILLLGEADNVEPHSIADELEEPEQLRANDGTGSRQNSGTDLICIDTDSRSAAPEEAARRVTRAVKLLQDAGVEWIYKKVDSVLRGRVTVELEAILNALGFKRALLVPANPSRGRTIEGGQYFIHGKPIHQTEFGNDPEHPRTVSDVLQLLGPGKHTRVRICSAKASLPSSGLIVGEAASLEDLQYWAGRRTTKTLKAGAAEFFAALLSRTDAGGTANLAVLSNRPPNLAPRKPEPIGPVSHQRACGLVARSTPDSVESLPQIQAGGTLDFSSHESVLVSDGAELFICGTTSQSGRDFLAAARLQHVPIFSLPAELAWQAEFTDAAKETIAGRVTAALRSSPRVILTIGLPRLRDAAKARPLVLHLIELAGTVLRQVNVSQVYAEGGATAAALMRRMNWHRLDVLRELAPGVATLRTRSGSPMTLTIKPGSYVWPPAVRAQRIDSQPLS